MIPCTLDNEDHQRNMKSESVLGQRGPLACWTLCTYSWLNSQVLWDPQNKGSQTFALEVQHDGQRVPLQHLLAFVIQLNSQCGSPAFLDKGKRGHDEHWSYKTSPFFSLPARTSALLPGT